MLERFAHANGVVVYQSPLLAHVPHGFSTRVGGVSVGPFAALNLGNPNGCPTQDDLANIAENYRRLQAAIGRADRERAQVHQVHGCDVARASAGASFDFHAKADALITDDPARLLSVRTADCVPVLIASRDGRYVGAAHAGWRGAVAGVASATVRAMIDAYALPGAGELVAAIGPSIGPAAFEVGPEVIAEFEAAFGADAPVIRPAVIRPAAIRPAVTRDAVAQPNVDQPAVAHAATRDTVAHAADGKGRIDLRAAVLLDLIRAGVPRDTIDSTDRCTVAHADEFFSHRRDHGVTGRMAALIGRK